MSSEARCPHVGGRTPRASSESPSPPPRWSVGAIVLSGCVVIQSESATQANVIGNSVTVTTALCASQAAAAAPCNSHGNSSQAAVERPERERLRPAARRLPHPGGRHRAGDDHHDGAVDGPRTAAPSTATLTLTQSPSYTAGLNAHPAACPRHAVGRLHLRGTRTTPSTGPQSVDHHADVHAAGRLHRAVHVAHGRRLPVVVLRPGDVTCPAPFPGVTDLRDPGPVERVRRLPGRRDGQRRRRTRCRSATSRSRPRRRRRSRRARAWRSTSPGSSRVATRRAARSPSPRRRRSPASRPSVPATLRAGGQLEQRAPRHVRDPGERRRSAPTT